MPVFLHRVVALGVGQVLISGTSHSSSVTAHFWHWAGEGVSDTKRGNLLPSGQSVITYAVV
jgi:hypothetical protein